MRFVDYGIRIGLLMASMYLYYPTETIPFNDYTSYTSKIVNRYF